MVSSGVVRRSMVSRERIWRRRTLLVIVILASAGCATHRVTIATDQDTAEIYLNGELIGKGEAVFTPENRGWRSSEQLRIVFDSTHVLDRALDTRFNWAKAFAKAAPGVALGSGLLAVSATADYEAMSLEAADIVSWGFILGPMYIACAIGLSLNSYEYSPTYKFYSYREE